MAPASCAALGAVHARGSSAVAAGARSFARQSDDGDHTAVRARHRSRWYILEDPVVSVRTAPAETDSGSSGRAAVESRRGN